jgi:GAF domain-containing protein
MKRRDKAAKGRPRKALPLKRTKAPRSVRRHRPPVVGQSKIAELTRELSEALEQQTATAEVLKVISRSSVDLDSVLDTLVQTVARLCRADQVYMFHLRHDLWHLIADCGLSAETSEFFETHPFTPGRGSTSGRAALERRAVLIPDVLQDPEYALSEGQEIAGYRTVLGIPLLREDTLIGVYSIARTRVEPFTDKEIEIATSFADQAVIAIENARLLNELRERTDGLAESLEQQTATSEVLKVISTSSGELQPVFETLLENATRLCDAKFGNLYLSEGDAFRTTAMHNAPPAFAEARHREPLMQPEPGSLLQRMRDTKAIVHVEDATKDPAYINRQPRFVSAVELGGFRSILAVPMLKEDHLIGTILVYRQEVSRFTDKQIELVQNFAAQAVIAIENARLLSELREALAQQTGTSEVLRAISLSPGELQPVFDTMLAKATDLCEASYGALWLRDGETVRAAALHGALPEAYRERLRGGAAFMSHPDRPGTRAMNERRPIQVTDLREEPAYRARDPLAVAAAEDAGIRTLMCVPMFKDGQAVGNITIYRREVRPFSDKQVELLANFAAQAVIAIENARLLSELRESLEQQTATSEVLKVISSSPGELEPVFQAMLENATRICEAKFGLMYRYDNGAFHPAAMLSAPPALAEFVRQRGSFQPPAGTPLDRLLKTGDAIYTADETAESNAGAAVKHGHARSLIAVPMLKENRLIGAIVIYRQEVRPFTEKQIELVQNFAAQAVIAVENARLLSELREALEQQTATAEVLKVIASSSGELQQVFKTMLANATRLCEAKYGALWLREGDAFRTAALHGPLPHAYLDQWRSGTLFRPSPDVPMARVAATGRPVQVEDLRTTDAYRSGDRLAVTGVNDGGIRTVVAVPVLKDKELVGVIAIYRTEVKPFADKQIKLVQNFGAQAVIAIENTRLLNELRESLQQQTATADVLKVISRSTFDLRAVLDTLVESAARLCQADMASINREKGAAYQQVANYGHSAELQAYMDAHPIPADRGSVVGRAIEKRGIIHIPDVLSDPEYKMTGAATLGGIHTMLGVPLLRQGIPIGVIVLQRKAVRPFTNKEIELVETFADQAVIAMENTRLLNELRESLQQQTATADVLKVISRSTFDLQTVLDTLTESAARLCEADMAAIVREKDTAHYWATSYGFPPGLSEYLKSIPVTPGRGSVVGRVLLDGKAVNVPDALADPEYTYAEAQKRGGYRTMLGVPLLREGMPLGVLLLMRRAVRPFTDKQTDLVSTFADQAVIAIENVRLFESVEARTRELAKSLEDLRTTQDRLVQTEKLASLGQLTAGIAHEIKNPLNFVNNFSAVSVELIDELRQALGGANLDIRLRAQISEIADMLQGNLDKVVQHGQRADSIVKNMLLHSRSGSGEHRPVDINALVEESLNLAYHGARAEKQGFNITLERALDPTAGEVDLFPQEITRALLNLIMNGFYAATKRKAEANGGNYEPTLAASTKSLGDRVEIRIRDNGTGIPPEVKERMFNPFFTTKPAGEGTGLGLSISHDIVVKQHGGSIEVDTQPGAFTEFRIVLPRTAAIIAKSGERA